MSEFYSTDDVFGISRDIPLNYVVRDEVDQVLVDSLKQKGHIVIHGSSKQGKTCLRKSHLKDTPIVFVQCNQNWELSQLHSAILKAAGYQIEQSDKKTVTGKAKVNASAGFKPFGIGVQATGEGEAGIANETVTVSLDLDPHDVNDVIAALDKSGCSKLVVLEDFHYLPRETQDAFAYALKAFHEASEYQFIIVGVWREENRLIVANGDLTGRVVSVNADRWSKDELREVIRSGESKLNVAFLPGFKNELVENCMDSVYIVQEVARLACKRSGVMATQLDRTVVGQNLTVNELIREIVNQQRGRYLAFINGFSDGFQDTELEMYRWLLYPVVSSPVDELEAGLKYSVIKRIIQEVHPLGKGLNVGNLTQALKYSASLQVKKNIKPIILDYDATNRVLNIMDRGFLIWLNSQDRQEVLADAGLL